MDEEYGITEIDSITNKCKYYNRSMYMRYELLMA